VAEPSAGFASLLRKLRREARLTQEELAEAAALSVRAVAYLERGVVTTPQKETVRLLAEALRLVGPVRAEFEAAARGRAAQGAVAAATRTLPRDIASFTGRQRELEQLAEAVAGARQVVGIHAIGGMAGVGKTAFAVHAAHVLADRFPGGQIYLPLHAHTPGRQPVSPADALASLLLTIGVPAGEIPADLEARTGLWRDRAARRQFLIVLDDAADTEQVRALLPGVGGSLVLITSRRRLTALEDAAVISLDTLPPGEAAELLVRLAVRPGLSSSDPGVGEVTRLCGFLPLAIGMVARQLHHHPAWTVADRAAELAAAADRLAHLAAEHLSAAAAFDLSYRDLTAGERRLFRRLALHPGPTTDAYAAAALDGVGLTAARLGLKALYEHNLIAEPSAGRYRMHDLIAEYAAALAAREESDDERAGATGRLLDYYQYESAQAEAQLPYYPVWDPGPAVAVVPAAVPVLGDGEQALAWLRAERAGLLACLDQATAAGQHARVIALTATLVALLFRHGPWDEAIRRHLAAAGAAREIGDRRGLARSLTELADLRMATGDIIVAARELDEALRIWRELGEPDGLVAALDRRGSVRTTAGDFAGAIQDLRSAIGIAEDTGNRTGKAKAQQVLGAAYRQIADFAAAERQFEEALAYFRDAADKGEQAVCLYSLGDVRSLMGNHSAAERALQEALRLYQDTDDKLGQASALTFLGRVRLETGDEAAAAECLREALDIDQSLGHRNGEAITLGYLGRLHLRWGDYQAAAEHLLEALAIFHDDGNPGSEAHVLNDCGAVALARGDLGQARSYHQQALGLARQIGIPRAEANALAGLARCDRAAGDAAAAEAGLRQALAIFQQTGSAEGPRVAAELSALTSEANPSNPKAGQLGLEGPPRLAGSA